MRLLLLAGVAGLALTVSAHAVTITVTPSLAPNAFGSPSYAGYVANATGALHDGQTSRGDASLPTYYQAQSTVTASQSIVTPFPSWMGKADPGSVYGPAFANELGNRMLFGLKIDGNGTQFAIANLSFSAASNDAGNSLGFSFAVGHYNYGTEFEGVLKGADGILFTADDVYVTSGSADQLVDGLVGRGSGASLAADTCSNCSVQDQQALITAAASTFTAPTAYTGTYFLGRTEGSGTFNIIPDALATAVPEPASFALLGLGVAGVAAVRRRRAG